MSEEVQDHPHGDSAPGDGPLDGSGALRGIVGYAIGLAIAAGLTVASFYVARTPLLWGPGIPAALIVFAIAQMGVHLVFFLHITSGPESTNNVLALAFGLLIVFLLLAGSLFIMTNLNHDMLSLGAVMGMQK